MQSSQSSIIIYPIILIGFVAGFLYNSNLDPAARVPVIDQKFQLASMQGLKNIVINDAILQSEQFKSLKVFGQMPVQTTSGGKNNPFQ